MTVFVKIHLSHSHPNNKCKPCFSHSAYLILYRGCTWTFSTWLTLFSIHFQPIYAMCLLSCVLLFVTPTDYSPPGSSVHGNSPGKNTGVNCYFLLQWIFPTQGSNPGLPHCRWILYHLSHQGSIINYTNYLWTPKNLTLSNWLKAFNLQLFKFLSKRMFKIRDHLNFLCSES